MGPFIPGTFGNVLESGNVHLEDRLNRRDEVRGLGQMKVGTCGVVCNNCNGELELSLGQVLGGVVVVCGTKGGGGETKEG